MAASNNPAVTVSQLLFWLMLAMAFLIPYQLHYNVILNQFYGRGAEPFDTGLHAALIWRNDWSLMVSAAMSHNALTFYIHHISPFLFLVTALSHVLPVNMVEFYAGFIAMMYTSYALIVYLMLTLLFRLSSPIALIFALAIGFNGYFMDDALWLPHYELYMPVFIITFLMFLAFKQYWLALPFFVLALMVREDGGFHITAILGLLICCRLYQKKPLISQQYEAAFLIVALLWGITAFFIKKTYFPGHNLETNQYFGSPIYSHLTWDLIQRQLEYLWYGRSVIWAPFLVTLLWWWFARPRNHLLLVGFLANIPWFIIGFLSVLGGKYAKIYGYYAFPFLWSIVWPMLAAMFEYGRHIPDQQRYATLKLQALVLLATLIGYNGYDWKFFPFHNDFLVRPAITNRQLVDIFSAKLESNIEEFGKVRVDSGILSLVPSVLRIAGQSLPTPEKAKVDSIIYFSNGSKKDAAVKDAVTHGLAYTYSVTGTNIRIHTNRTLDRLPSFTGHLSPVTK